MATVRLAQPAKEGTRFLFVTKAMGRTASYAELSIQFAKVRGE